MFELVNRIRSLGGVASVRDLRASSTQRRGLARAVQRGTLRRVRTGVYAVPDAHPDLIRAARLGGRIAGVSALPHHGIWTPPTSAAGPFTVEVHVAVAARRESGSSPARVCWSRERSWPQFGVVSLVAALAQAANDLPLPFAVAVLDSALRSSPLTPVGLLLDAAGWRPRARAAAALTDERSESGTESVLRVLLHEAGIRATPQPPLPLGRDQRADLLVGDRLLIECDSEGHHADPANRRSDLRRDELLVALGYIVLRLDYTQVFGDPVGSVASIAAVVVRGDHLSSRPTVVM